MTGSPRVFKQVKDKCKGKTAICALLSSNRLKLQPKRAKSDIRNNSVLIKSVKCESRAMKVFKMDINLW